MDFSPLKGREALHSSEGGGKNFQPFVPQIRWSKDEEERYILLLSPIDENYTADLHQFIEVGEGEKANGDKYKKFEEFVSRKSLGERRDDIEDRLDRAPKRRTLGVAVELEPVFETVKGRKRPKSFIVKTEEFTRKTDDGEVDVQAPIIGVITQARKNFYGWLDSYDRTTAPVHETPMKVVRRGTDSETQYDFVPHPDVEVDFNPLFDNVENVAYIRDDVEDIEADIKAADNPMDAASAIGIRMLERRWAELTDSDRYHEFIDPIDELPPSRFGNSSSKGKDRAARGERVSPRPSSNGGSKAEEKSEDEDDSDKRSRFAALREEVEQGT